FLANGHNRLPFIFYTLKMKGGHFVRKVSVITLLLVVVALGLRGCSDNKSPTLMGFYQSEPVNGYIIQMSFYPDDRRFVAYIDNREVEKGTYEKLDNDVYKLNGEVQEFEIRLNKYKSFDVIIKKLNDGKPISLKKIGDTPVSIGT